MLRNAVSDSDSDSPTEFQIQQLKIKNFSDAVDDYEETVEVRQTNLENMNKIIHRLLKKGSVDREAQTEGNFDFAKENGEQDKGDKTSKSANRKDVRSSIGSDSISRLTRPMSGGSTLGQPNQPVDNNLVAYNKPLNLQGVINQEKMKEYHMRLNELLNYHKNNNSRPGDATP